MAIENTTTSKTTLFPVKTGTSTGQFGIQINPQNPASAPNIVDINGTTVGTWNPTSKSWVPLDSNPDATVGTVGVDNTPIGAFLNQNSETFTANTVRIIDKLPDNQKSAFKSSNTFSPYTDWANKTSPEGGVGGGSDPSPTPAKPEKIDATPIKASGARSGANSYGDHVYPESLRSSTQDKVKFTMVEYKPKSFDAESFEFKPTTQNETILGSVILPIPSGISESNQAVWGENELNAAEAAAASVALKAIGEGPEAGGQEASAYFQSVQEKSKDVIKGITNAFGAAATGVSGAGLLSRTTGAVINSNLELLFNRPSLRPFSFTFKMSARNENEARSIIRIIKFFKQGMSPQKSKSNIFLKSPNIFKIEYLHRNETHPYIGQIKECALQSCTVNYTPEGQYATFYDGVLVSYEIQMQFTELEPVFNDDYGSSGDLSADLLFKK